MCFFYLGLRSGPDKITRTKILLLLLLLLSKSVAMVVSE